MIKDTIKTLLFFAAMAGLLMFIGSFFGKGGFIFSLIVAIIMGLFAYFFSDRMVLRMYGARPLDPHTYPGIYAMVGNLSQKMNIPMPKLWLVQSPMPNAFATGRNPRHASVAITTGLLEILEENELRGVLAHELSHVKNRDILFASIATTLAVAIGYLSQSLRATVQAGDRNQDEQQKQSRTGILLAAMLTPFAAQLMRLAISRSREFLADESGAHYSEDPLALASALKKLQEHSKMSQLTGGKMPTLFTLLLSHPMTGARIERLRKIYEDKMR